MQQTYETLKHTTWECKYHVVFIPKCRRKALFAQLRRDLGPVFRSLAEQKECKVEEGHLMPDHVHMLLSCRPNTRCRRSWGSSKARVRSTLHGCMPGEDGTSSGSISGRVAIGCRRWERTRLRCVDTSRSRRKKTAASNSWRSRRFERLTITINRFERFTLSQASGFAGGR